MQIQLQRILILFNPPNKLSCNATQRLKMAIENVLIQFDYQSIQYLHRR
jgi:hypothetical protein